MLRDLSPRQATWVKIAWPTTRDSAFWSFFDHVLIRYSLLPGRVCTFCLRGGFRHQVEVRLYLLDWIMLAEFAITPLLSAIAYTFLRSLLQSHGNGRAMQCRPEFMKRCVRLSGTSVVSKKNEFRLPWHDFEFHKAVDIAV
jgi:hypothetical protein